MDKAIKWLINNELKRQQDGLEMIASENYISKEVLEAYSNVFTNKYSEGYPGKRYYGGQEYVDRLEILTQFRALAIFDLLEGEVGRGLKRKEKVGKISYERYLELEKLVLDPTVSIGKLVSIYDEITHKIGWGVNVQPLSGSPANLAVYVGLLEPGDTILGMDLSAGGHLSHGHRLNASGKFFNIVTYGVRKDNYLIDYDDILQKALEYKPRLIIAGYSAYPRDLNYKRFYEIAEEVEKVHGYRPILMADIAHIAGLIAGGVLSNDLWKYFDVVTTTTHKTLRGPRGALIYYKRDRVIEVRRESEEVGRGGIGRKERSEEKKIDEKIYKIIGIAIDIHKRYKDTLTEYQIKNMLFDRLKEEGFEVKKEVPLDIEDNGKIYGKRYVDLVVDDEIIIELKNTIIDREIKKGVNQLRQYLNLGKYKVGLLLNFGSRGILEKIRLNNYQRSLQTSTRSSDLYTLINRGVFPGVQGGPHVHIIAAKAVAFWEILKNEKKDWKNYAQQVVKNAQVLAEELVKKGWKVFTGGTDNHIVLVDVANSFPELKLDGKIAEETLEKIGISINKNAIPYDTRPPLRPSGIRIGTPAITTRGLKEKEILKIADIIDKALKNWKNEEMLKKLKEEVLEICNQYKLWY